MTSPERNAAYLGGIGTMLSQVEICPNCGLDHSEVVYSGGRRVERGCSRSVVGALPYLSRAWEGSLFAEFDEVELSAEQSPVFAAFPPRRFSARDPPLAVHLPPPPEAEEVRP